MLQENNQIFRHFATSYSIMRVHNPWLVIYSVYLINFNVRFGTLSILNNAELSILNNAELMLSFL